jgi:hypothetical protein
MKVKELWKKYDWIFYLILVIISLLIFGGIAIISN